MITGFNTDVSYGGCLYHVQTEDRGRDHPFLESLVYVGGTIIAKKLTPYPQDSDHPAGDDVIAPLLRRQHQVIIAAIRAGRIEELVRHSSDQKEADSASEKTAGANGVAQKQEPGASTDTKQSAQQPVVKVAPPAAPHKPAEIAAKPGDTRPAPVSAPPGPPVSSVPEKIVAETRPVPPGAANAGAPQTAGDNAQSPASVSAGTPAMTPTTGSTPAVSGRLGLNLDQVVSDYLKRSSEQGKLDVKVLSPRVFTAGSSVAVKVQIVRGRDPEPDSIVTVKVIGTAFKPQVYMSRADQNGVATFNFSLPAFSAGTAAIVIEAQSNRGRGELKQLIRRA